jgi:peptidyl-tRNA hydrolase
MGKPDPDEVVMYIIMRKDLGMSVGKLMAQSGHAAERISRNIRSRDPDWRWVRVWDEHEYPKVTLEVHSEQELLKHWQLIVKSDYLAELIKDVGRNEIVPSFTCIGLEPMPRSVAAPFVRRLQAFKGQVAG